MRRFGAPPSIVECDVQVTSFSSGNRYAVTDVRAWLLWCRCKYSGANSNVALVLTLQYYCFLHFWNIFMPLHRPINLSSSLRVFAVFLCVFWTFSQYWYYTYAKFLITETTMTKSVELSNQKEEKCDCCVEHVNSHWSRFFTIGIYIYTHKVVRFRHRQELVALSVSRAENFSKPGIMLIHWSMKQWC